MSKTPVSQAQDPVPALGLPAGEVEGLKQAIWNATLPFQDELVRTGGVTFMGLRNAVAEAVRTHVLAPPASAADGGGLDRESIARIIQRRTGTALEAADAILALAPAVPPTRVAGPDRKTLTNAVYRVLRDYRLSNMGDEDGGNYPLVDAVTPEGRGIDEGETELGEIAFYVADAIIAPTPGETPGQDAVAGAIEALEQIENGLHDVLNEQDGTYFETAMDTEDMAEVARTALASLRSTQADTGGERVRHVKRGTEYEVLHRGVELQVARALFPAVDRHSLFEGDRLVIYRGSDGKLWAREEGEFDDGRFKPAPTPLATGGESRTPAPAGDAVGAQLAQLAKMTVALEELNDASEAWAAHGGDQAHRILPLIHPSFTAVYQAYQPLRAALTATPGETPGPARVGRKVPRNVYWLDEPLFVAPTPELAATIVAALNAGSRL